MNKLLLAALLSVCFAGLPAFAHTFTGFGSGWTGPHAGGGTTNDHPEKLCSSFGSNACIVAGTESVSFALQKQPIQVTNSAGLNVGYLTNNTNTPGWIVVIGATGLSWGFTPNPASVPEYSYICTQFSPGNAGGTASLSWNTSSANYYYQAVFSGSYFGTPCFY